MFYASWDACVPHTKLWLQLTELGRMKKFNKDHELYRQGARHPNFYLIRSGFVQADMMHPDGKKLTLELMGPGTIFGEGAAFENSPRYINIKGMTDITLSCYSPPDITESPHAVELLTSLVKIMSGKQRALASKLLQFTADDPERRIRQLLARLATVQRSSCGSLISDPITIYFSQEQIGEMCGLSRVSVSRTLRNLANDGILVTHVKQIEILNAVALWNDKLPAP